MGPYIRLMYKMPGRKTGALVVAISANRMLQVAGLCVLQPGPDGYRRKIIIHPSVIISLMCFVFVF